MKMHEILNEDEIQDLSDSLKNPPTRKTKDFWGWVDEIDQGANPEGYRYRKEQEEQTRDGTTVVTKYKDSAPRHTNRVRKGTESSPGFRGNAQAQHRAGHISDEVLKRKLQQD